jgi:hypothetical protein
MALQTEMSIDELRRRNEQSQQAAQKPPQELPQPAPKQG